MRHATDHVIDADGDILTILQRMQARRMANHATELFDAYFTAVTEQDGPLQNIQVVRRGMVDGRMRRVVLEMRVEDLSADDL